MAKRFTAITGGTALALAFVFAALQSCSSGGDKTGAGGNTGGGGTNGGNVQQVCEQFCNKLGTCFADAGIPTHSVVASCKSSVYLGSADVGRNAVHERERDPVCLAGLSAGDLRRSGELLLRRSRLPRRRWREQRRGR